MEQDKSQVVRDKDYTVPGRAIAGPGPGKHSKVEYSFLGRTITHGWTQGIDAIAVSLQLDVRCTVIVNIILADIYLSMLQIERIILWTMKSIIK